MSARIVKDFVPAIARLVMLNSAVCGSLDAQSPSNADQKRSRCAVQDGLPSDVTDTDAFSVLNKSADQNMSNLRWAFAQAALNDCKPPMDNTAMP